MTFKRILVVLGAVVATVGLLGFVFLEPIRRWLVVAYTPEYRAPAAPRSGVSPHGVEWVKVAEGFDRPTDVEFVPGGNGAAIVLEKGGKARYTVPAKPGRAPSKPATTPVLALDVLGDSELGLLGLAFHPDYPKSGLFYVNYNPAKGKMRTRVSEWTLPGAELGRSSARSERVVLEVDQPYPNHKGGQLAFGPDGYLYVGLGDGGFRNDPHGNGQNLGVLLGKMLRIDIASRTAGGYGVPADNPFVGKKGIRPEIWASGLRNPWRFSFDPLGRLVAGDVGQDTWEEVDIVHAGDNLGWNVREARHCFEPKEGCRTQDLVEPVFEYGRESGSCITGGYVYTGTDVPELQGKYVFGDFVSGMVWAMKLPGPDLASNELSSARELGKWPFLVSSFGRDEAGELYLLDYAGGALYRLTAK
jgi:glucose/arabinose dehydrogenase